MIHLETPRLALRDWKASDLDVFMQMNADERVMRYFPKPLQAGETMAFYEAVQAEIREAGYGLYAVEVKENKAFVGFIGFHRATFEADFTPCLEIGWRLKQEAWGRGYATEGAAACLDHGFRKLGFKDVYSFTAEINHPSRHVMKKIGMRYAKSFNHPKVDESSPLYRHVLYHISAEVHMDRSSSCIGLPSRPVLSRKNRPLLSWCRQDSDTGSNGLT